MKGFVCRIDRQSLFLAASRTTGQADCLHKENSKIQGFKDSKIQRVVNYANYTGIKNERLRLSHRQAKPFSCGL
jgi:hypothetical protein